MASFRRHVTLNRGGLESREQVKSTNGGADRRKARGRIRRGRLQQAIIDTLENRTLLASVPTAVSYDLPVADVGSRLIVNDPQAPDVDEISPAIAYDPLDPRKIVVATSSAPRGPYAPLIRLGYSTDGGATWTSNAFTFGGHVDPIAAPAAFAEATDPSLAFDRLGNVYLVFSEHPALNSYGGYDSGRIEIAKLDFNGPVPVVTYDKPLFRWAMNGEASHEGAYFPSVVVDNNPLSFTDPDTTAVQADGLIDPATGQGNVYVTYHTDWNWNPDITEHGNSVMLMASHDGGLNFSTASAANDRPWMLQDAVGQSSYPRMAVSQGTADGRVQPGQLTVVWDDYTNGIIWTDRVQDGVSASEFTNWSGPFVDPLAPLGGVYYTINVNITDPNFVLSDFDTTLNMQGNMAGVLIDLQAPNNMLFNLVDWHHRTARGGPWQNMNNLGERNNNLLNGAPAIATLVGTVFDSEAPRYLSDDFNEGPWAGHFRPDTGDFAIMNGETPTQLNGTWVLYVDALIQPRLDEWKLTFTSQMTSGTDRRVVGPPSPYQPLPGKAVGPFPTASAIRPDQGIGPAPTIASDNTLGSFSEYQGRLYVAWVRSGGTGDIIFATSDDGALTWSISGKINDDNGTIDGYAGLDGSPRTQLEPELAVDLTTGTLVATWLDARHDASNARVATYIATSINGGSTWSPQTYMNVPAAPTDAITQQPVDIGPIPGNQTASNAAKTVYNFGDRQGLTVWGGHVYAAFSANMNGGALDCVVAEAEIPAGPRIINSTMGPVSEWNDRLNPPTPDGPAVQAFEVQFDRLIDPNTFGPDDITMIFRDEATPGSAPGTIIPIASVTPLDEGYYGPAQAHGATMFRIMLVDPQTAVGTYSYMVAAGISDRIRSLAERMVGGTTTVFQSTASMPLRPVPCADVVAHHRRQYPGRGNDQRPDGDGVAGHADAVGPDGDADFAGRHSHNPGGGALFRHAEVRRCV